MNKLKRRDLRRGICHGIPIIIDGVLEIGTTEGYRKAFLIVKI
jgi:hypothetical protein